MICSQEHFQLKNCKFRITNSFSDNFELYFKPAIKANSALGRGRPKGGLFIAWKKTHVRKAKRLECNNFRIQAIILEYESCKLLIINTYFPCDSQKLVLSVEESTELQKLLADISELKQKYSGKFDTAFILGDLNFDDNRFTGHTQAISNYFEKERLCSVWNFFPVDFTYAFGESRSTLDHFIISNTQANIILESGAVHDPENVSGHSPIYVKVNLQKANNPPEKICRKPMLNWAGSSPEQRESYTEHLEGLLSHQDLFDTPECLQCQDILCTHVEHREQIDQVSRDLLGTVVDSAWENLETTKGTTGDQKSRAHTIPGWNDLVKPYHGEARFWYSLWLSAGKPIHSSVPGVEHDLYTYMKTSRNQYHYAVRRAQNSLNIIENDKLLSKIDSPDIFEDIKRSCKEKNSDLTSVVDDVHGAKNISSHFKTLYEDLYNEQQDISPHLVADINNNVADNPQNSTETVKLFSPDVVKAAIKKLKNDKSDVSGTFTSDCLKSAPALFHEHLSRLFQAFLIHGYISHDLLICALSPIVKDPNGDISSSKNYRGIAISSLILKVLDNCILLLFGQFLSNDALQFGFQKGCSTVQCTWAVQETVSYYLRRGSSVFCCLLDFSKAFDKVNFDALFMKLRERNFPAVVLRLLVHMYMNQSCFIRWNSIESEVFSVKNGVRQGAILSPSLFCVYLDTLLCQLRDAGVGCHIGGTFLGAFGYADDVLLLAPTRQALQIMLTICENFATSHSMQFSTDADPAKSKTKCLIFSRTIKAEQVSNVRLNGDNLPWVKTAKHLGNLLSSKIDLSCSAPDTKTDLLQKRAILFDKVHQILQQFGYLNPRLVIKLLSIYSTALYGSCLWKLASEEHLKLNRSWNAAVKMIWNLPHSTHTRFLESLTSVPHLESTLMSRYIGFIDNLMKSKKSLLKLIFTCSTDLSSLTGQNVAYLLSKYKKTSLKELTLEKYLIRKIRVYPLQMEESWKINLIEEISLMKLSLLEVEFDMDNIEEILEHICTE